MKIDNKNKIMMAIFIVMIILSIGEALSQPSYEVFFNKNTYELNENILITVNKPENTTVQLIYQKISPIIEYEPVSINISETEQEIKIASSGTYQLRTNLYDNNNTIINSQTNTNLQNNEVKINTFQLEILVDKTTIPKNNDLKLVAIPTNNQGITTYKWYLNDGTGIIKTGKEITHNFPNTGTHKIILEAEDSNKNNNTAEITITVQDARIIWVEVRSDATNELIEGAEVNFGIASAKTDNLGRALFYLPIRTYILEVSKSQYRNTRQYVDVTKDATYSVFMGRDRKEYDPPAIIADTLLKATINADIAILEFEVYDENPTMCETYLKREGSAWKFIQKYEVLGETKVYKTEFSNLKPTRYDWRIDCEDSQGNRATTNSYFYVDFDSTYQDTQTPTNNTSPVQSGTLNVNYSTHTGKFIEQITNIKQGMNLYSDDQKVIASTLEQIIELNIAEKEAREWESALFRLTRESSIENYNTKEKEIIDAIEKKKKQVIEKIEITESKTTTLTNTKQLLDLHYKNTGRKITEKTIETKIIKVRVDLLSGESKYYTFITHKNFEEGDSILVNFPANFAQSRAEINTKNNIKLIKDNLVLEFAPINKEVTYYVEGSKTLTDVDAKTYVVTTSDTKKSTNNVTGNSISISFDTIKENFLFILVGLMLIAYVFYNYEVGDKIQTLHTSTMQSITRRNLSEQTKIILREIKEGKKIVKQDLTGAKAKYTQAMISYQGLTSKEKEQVYADAISLHCAIVERKMDDLIDLVDKSMNEKNTEHAKTYLKRLEKMYDGLEGELKNKLKYKVVLANMNVEQRHN